MIADCLSLFSYCSKSRDDRIVTPGLLEISGSLETAGTPATAGTPSTAGTLATGMPATAGRPETLETQTAEGTSIAMKTAAKAETTATAEAPGKSTAVRTLPIAGFSTAQDANKSGDARSCLTLLSMMLVQTPLTRSHPAV
jgi:hypothetical protein